MGRYLTAARRQRWIIIGILALVWGAAGLTAYRQYATTFESHAMVWVLRPSPELTNIDPQDPGTPIIQTMAVQQTELLTQLLRTDSFLREVVERTSLRSELAASADEPAFLQQVRKRFSVETLGTNLFSVSYTSSDRRTPPEMVSAALDVRRERVLQARATNTAAVGTLYQREYEAARRQADDAAAALDEFRAAHTGPRTSADATQEAQLQLAVDYAQARLNDLRGRADRAAVASAVLELSGLDFQIVDEPREPRVPSGGGRAAAMTALVGIASGVLLAGLLVLATAHLDRRARARVDVLVPAQRRLA